jgi:hypothetical protein
MTNRSVLLRHQRAGTLLLAVVVCLVVVSVIVFGGLTQSLKLQRQSLRERTQEQIRWLLDAGVSRAVRSLKADPTYAGESLALKWAWREYQPSLSIAVTRSNPDQSLTVEVVARMVPVEKPSVAIPVQRSFRFQFDPSTQDSSRNRSN